MSQKPKVDPYLGVKYLGYRLSQLPDKYKMADLLRFAKFQLAVKSRRLLKDPIWDEYTVEELLQEFYAHVFNENKEARILFEQSLNLATDSVDDFAAWADAEIAKEDKIREKIMDSTEDSVSFNPSDVLGDDNE
jgi:hypothetical protein